MIDPKILLVEKIKYGLEPIIFDYELEQLKNDVPVQKNYWLHRNGWC